MKQLTCIIIDDEHHSRDTTKMFLEMVCPEVTIIDSLATAMEGAEAIKQHHPDFILLDIQMPQMTGIEMLSIIPEYSGEIIFLTAHDQYAVTAFKKGALHFLLKPLDPEELKDAVQRVRVSLHRQASTDHGNWMSISTSDGWAVLRKADIIRCESYKNYTTIYCHEEKHTISKTLKEVEAKLSAEKFYRVHHSHLIQIDHIQKVLKSDGGNVLMANGDLIPISKAKKKEFFDWFQSHMDQV